MGNDNELTLVDGEWVAKYSVKHSLIGEAWPAAFVVRLKMID